MPRLRSRVGAAFLAALIGALAWAGEARAADCCALTFAAFGGSGVVMSPDDKFVYVTGAELGVFAFDQATGKLTRRQEIDQGADPIAITPDGRFVVTASAPQLIVWRRDAGTGRLTRISTAKLDYGSNSMAMSADGRELFVTGASGSVGGVNTVPLDANGHLGTATRLPTRYGATQLSLSPNGRTLLASTFGGLAIWTRDGTGAAWTRRPTDAFGAGLFWTPDGRRVLFSDTIAAYDPDTHTVNRPDPMTAPFDPRDGGAFPPQPTVMVGAGQWVYGLEGAIHQIRLTPSGVAYERLYQEYEDGIRGLRYGAGITISRDGRWLLVAGANNNGVLHVPVFRRDPATGSLSFRSQYVLGVPDPGVVPQTEPFHVVINDGAEFTNDPRVEVEIRGNSSPSQYIGNDGGIEHMRKLATSPDHTYTWTLDSSGPERLPKTVYVWNYNAIVSDEIVLDERPPVVVAARLTRRRRSAAVKVVARDRTAGVAAVQFARRRNRPGVWHKVRRSHRYTTARSAVWVRARDRAGNRSAWKKARVAR